jgi:hypothetical protein
MLFKAAIIPASIGCSFEVVFGVIARISIFGNCVVSHITGSIVDKKKDMNTESM